jgi:hypothetical protein
MARRVGDPPIGRHLHLKLVGLARRPRKLLVNRLQAASAANEDEDINQKLVNASSGLF